MADLYQQSLYNWIWMNLIVKCQHSYDICWPILLLKIEWVKVKILIMLNESEILLRDKVEFQFRHDQDNSIQYPYQHDLKSLKEARIYLVKISSQEIKQHKLGKK